MKLIQLIAFICLFVTNTKAQERLDITIKVPSIEDSSRLNIHLLDLGKVFFIDEVVPKEGLQITRLKLGDYPKLQIIDNKTDSVYLVLLKGYKGDIAFDRIDGSDKLKLSTEDFINYNDSEVCEKFYNARREYSNIAEFGKLANLGRKELEKSDSLRNRIKHIFLEMNAIGMNTIKTYPSDFIAFDIFEQEFWMFKHFVGVQDTILKKGYYDFMENTFSDDIKSTKEYQSLKLELLQEVNKKEEITKIDPSYEFKSIDSKLFKLSDIKSKYILIDFWATWCPPCMQMVPHIKQLREDFSHVDLEIVGISSDHNLKNLTRGIEQNKMNWIHVYDETRKIKDDFQVGAIPTLFILNQEGEILWRGEGFSEKKVSEIREILQVK